GERPGGIWKRGRKTGRGIWVGRREAVVNVRIRVNGAWREDEVEPRLLLVHYLREVAGLNGTDVGCETLVCGASAVLVNTDGGKGYQHILKAVEWAAERQK